MSALPTYTQVELTPMQADAWGKTRLSLLWHCPAFTHILYTMMDNAGSKHVALFTREVPIAATDGTNLLLNPDEFFKYKLAERVFIVAHEIMHCIWNHIVLMHTFTRRGKVIYADGTTLPYEQDTMNVATDLVINASLIEGKVGMFNKDWLFDPKITGAMSAIDVYKSIYRKKPPGGGKSGKGNPPPGAGADKGGNSPGNSPAQFDQHLPPGASKGQGAQDGANARNDVEWGTQIAAAINVAKAQGKLPAGLERLLTEVLEPKVDWTDKIAGLFARKVGSGSYDYRKPDRRLIVRDIYAPGRTGHGAGTVVVAVDTSGSITDKELNVFMPEIAGILEDVRPKRLVVMWCDAKVHRVDEVEEPSDVAELRAKGAPGGGGTNFIPVFKEIENMDLEPDALVYLTDGDGTFPKEVPSYMVVWGTIKENKYPFGDVVDVPKQA